MRLFPLCLSGILILSLSACSLLVSEGPARPISLEEVSWASPLRLVLVAEEQKSILYAVHDAGQSTGIFASTLSSCTVTENDSIETVTRRLFVGLENLRITGRERIEVGSVPFLRLTFQATLDQQPLSFVSISALAQKCSFDLVLWGEQRREGSSADSGTMNDEILSVARSLQATLMANDAAYVRRLVRQ